MYISAISFIMSMVVHVPSAYNDVISITCHNQLTPCSAGLIEISAAATIG